MASIDVNLNGQVALITGGSRGIGAATAVALGKAGASIAITYNRSREKAENVLRELKPFGIQAMALSLDLQNGDSIRSVVSQVMEKFGRIDILVNNAAVGSATVLKYSHSGKEDEAMLQINATGVLLCVQAVLPILLKQNYGKIISISSVDGGITVMPTFRLSDGMSKATVAFLTRQIVADHPHEQVDAFCVCPGAVDTQMFRESTLDHLPPSEREALIATLPQKRLILPQEIAQLILFLCTPAARICRGAVIDASFGLGVRPGLISETKK